jgi:hypothetical protein
MPNSDITSLLAPVTQIANRAGAFLVNHRNKKTSVYTTVATSKRTPTAGQKI